MADVQVEALISLGLDPQKAQQGIQALKDMQRGMDDAKKKAEETQRAIMKVAEAGAKLREVGTVMAGMGAAIIAPFALAANEYVKRFGQLESTSRNFLKAQERQADATARLGRIAAQALTPALNQVAAISEKIAAFAEKHPELVSAALGAGTALVVGGGALAMAGTAVASIAKAYSLLDGKLGAVGETLNKMAGIAIPVAAFVGGLKLGEIAVNKLGEATGDARLANYQLSDALKTVRQIVGGVALVFVKAFEDAKVTLGDFGDIIGGVGTLVGNGISDFIDQAVTGVQKFMVDFNAVLDPIKKGFDEIIGKVRDGFIDAINGIISAINSILDKLGIQKLGTIAKPQAPVGGGVSFSATPEEQKAQLDADYQARKAARDKAASDYGATLSGNAAGRRATRDANVAAAAGGIANFAETGSLGPGIDNAIKGVQNFISGIGSKLSNLTSGSGANRGGTGGPSPEQVNAYIAYRKEAAKADEQYARQVSEAKRNFDREEVKARASFERELADNRKEQERSLTDAATKYAQDRKNAAVKYEQETSDALKAFQSERAKAVRDFNRSEAETTDQQNRDRLRRARDFARSQETLAADRDVAGFIRAKQAYADQEADTREQEDADRTKRLDNFQAQLDDQQAAFDTANEQRRAQFDRENADAAAQYQQERQNILAQYAEKEADMRAQFDREAAERADNYRQQLADMQEQHARERAEREQAFLEAGKQFAGFIDNIQSKLASAKTQTYGPPVPSHAAGLDYVPYDNYLANLHKGERIVPASQNNGGAPTIIVNLTTSDVASKANIDEAVQRVGNALANVWKATR